MTYYEHVKLKGFNADLYVDLTGIVNVPLEIARKQKEVKKLIGLISGKEKKILHLTEHTPVDIIQKEQDDLKNLQEQLAMAQDALKRLLL
jgi:valyl-tRNA synthetase